MSRPWLALVFHFPSADDSAWVRGASITSPLQHGRISANLLMNRQLKNPPTVLIVNDDRVALDLFKDLLEPEGYKVLEAITPHRALEITASVRTDIIICDVVMPEINGIELCRRLKKDPLTTHTPVLLVSAVLKEEAAMLEGFAAGADDYIEIPFRHEE